MVLSISEVVTILIPSLRIIGIRAFCPYPGPLQQSLKAVRAYLKERQLETEMLFSNHFRHWADNYGIVYRRSDSDLYWIDNMTPAGAEKYLQTVLADIAEQKLTLEICKEAAKIFADIMEHPGEERTQTVIIVSK